MKREKPFLHQEDVYAARVNTREARDLNVAADHIIKHNAVIELVNTWDRDDIKTMYGVAGHLRYSTRLRNVNSA